MEQDFLLLRNQLCFPVYKLNRLILRAYQPLLEQLALTYPQYLVLMVLWEHKEMSVKEIGEQLMLNTNTLTPLLKRLEKRSLVMRKRSQSDERKVVIHLTSQGEELRKEARKIPEQLLQSLSINMQDVVTLKKQLAMFIDAIESASHQTNKDC